MARILLIEDNEMNRDMLSRRLARRGYEVAIAVDGEQGVALARAEAPALILMDMSLPGMDGWEATRRLKAAPETCAIPVIALTALDAALDAWEGVSMHDVRAASIALCDLFIAEVETRCPDLVLATTRDGSRRGSQVSFRHPEGYAIMQALIARGVIGDFRAPDAIRFGFTPLYIGETEVRGAVDILADIMARRLWDTPQYKRKALVT